MQHHVALPPDAMGKITYIAPAGQYSLKVGLLNFLPCLLHCSVWVANPTYGLQFNISCAYRSPLYLIVSNFSRKNGFTKS